MRHQKEACNYTFCAEFVAKSNSLRLNSRNFRNSRYMVDLTQEKNISDKYTRYSINY